MAKRRKEGPDQYWDYIFEKIKDGLELRRPFERQWVINIAFITGNQYTAFNTAAHTLHRIVGPPNKKRSVDNIILPKWERKVSDLIKARPRISVVPNSTQEEDIIAARTGAKAAEWYYRNNVLKKKIRNLATWMYSTGNSFLDDLWNPKAGPMGVNTKTGDIEYAGDVDSSVWSPFEIVVPARFGNMDLQSLPWMAKYQRKDLEWLAENYKRGDQVAEEKMGHNYITLESMITGLTGDPGLGRTKSAFLVHLYVKPCKMFKRGAFFAAANGIVFEKRDYPFDVFPMEHFKDIEYPGLFWGEAKVTHAIALQRSWNNDISSIEEFNQRMAKIKLRNPSGSNLTVVPDDQHGEVVNYKPVLGHKPEYMESRSTPPSLERNMERITFSMENLFSQHEVSRGTNRSDIRSGDMVERLLEQDAHGAIPSHAIFEEGLEAHLSRILMRMQAGYSTERTIKLGNTEDELEVIAFKGTDLRWNNDVKIVKESSLPDSKTSRELKVERRYQQGLLGDPNDPHTKRKTLRMLDDSIVDDIYSSYKQDESLAAWENRQMMRGIKLQVNNYDNHRIHVEELDRHRKSIRYQKLRYSAPQVFLRIDIIFSLHRQLHINFINEEMKKQMMLASARGQSGTKG